MNLDNIHSIFFIGIGGIGMSGLARYFHANGRTVSGYDKTPTPLTDEMIAEGMDIHFEENVSLIPKDVELVVYTPAIPDDHQELTYYREHGYEVVKRADLLETLTQDLFTIAVAGTHGKTTTSSMIAHILKSSGYDCTAFLGGIAANYNTNFLAGKNKTVVVEADEFDRSFLKLHPDMAVVTSTDPDHLDIYGDSGEVKKAYTAFTGKIKDDGLLITRPALSFLQTAGNTSTLYYSLDAEDKTSYYAANLHLDAGTYAFDFTGQNENIAGIHLAIAGKHNAENAVAAATVGSLLKIDNAQIREALNTFRGVKRRFEFIVKNSEVVYIDDYAHHPQEIHSFLISVREIFEEKKITCIFQPHLFTRTRDFADDFGSSLSICDELILLPIYPARELPLKGISSQMLLDKVSIKNKMVCEKKDLMEELKKRSLEVLVTVGAGDIDQFVEPIREMLEPGLIKK